MVASLLKAFLPEALLAYHETLARHSTEAEALLEELSNNSLQIQTVLKGDEGKALFCANTDCNLGRYVTVCEREVVHANTLLQEGLAYIHAADFSRRSEQQAPSRICPGLCIHNHSSACETRSVTVIA